MLPSDISCVMLAWRSAADSGNTFNARNDLLMAATSSSLLTPSGELFVSILPVFSKAATVSLRSCVCCTYLAQSVLNPGDMLRLSLSPALESIMPDDVFRFFMTNEALCGCIVRPAGFSFDIR